MQMIQETLILLLAVQLRIMRQSILYCSSKDMYRIDITIGLCNNLSVDAAGLMFRRSPMILYRPCHNFNLSPIKPTSQHLILPNDTSRHQMMNLPTPA